MAAEAARPLSQRVVGGAWCGGSLRAAPSPVSLSGDGRCVVVPHGMARNEEPTPSGGGSGKARPFRACFRAGTRSEVLQGPRFQAPDCKPATASGLKLRGVLRKGPQGLGTRGRASVVNRVLCP